MERLTRDQAVAFSRARSPRKLLRGETRDLSLNGMRLLSPVGLAGGELLRLDSDFCSAVAVARSAQAARSDGWECGLEFITLRLANDRRDLISTVAQLPGSGARANRDETRRELA